MTLREQYAKDYLYEVRLAPGSWVCELCQGRFSWESPTLLEVIDSVASTHVWNNHVVPLVPDA